MRSVKSDFSNSMNRCVPAHPFCHFAWLRSVDEGSMSRLRVFNPVARAVEISVAAALRRADLHGARVGLYWNMKSGGDVALQRVEAVLAQRYPDARFSYHQGDVGAAMRHNTPAAADRIARACDVVVGTSSD
jgi:hypothetical protein